MKDWIANDYCACNNKKCPRWDSCGRGSYHPREGLYTASDFVYDSQNSCAWYIRVEGANPYQE